MHTKYANRAVHGSSIIIIVQDNHCIDYNYIISLAYYVLIRMHDCYGNTYIYIIVTHVRSLASSYVHNIM